MSQSKALERKLTLTPSIMIVITAIVGSGIFTVPGTVMAAAQGSGTNLLAWIIAGVCCLLTAFVYAELAPAMPKAGGPYQYLMEAYGEKAAFTWGWVNFIGGQAPVLSLLALVFASYLGFFIPMSGLAQKVIATLVLIIAAGINIRGVKLGAVITTGFTVAKLVALGAIVIGGLITFNTGNFHPVINAHIGWSSAFTAAIPAIFAFDGYQQLAYMSEEVQNPSKTLPKALIIGMLIVILVNILISVVCTSSLGVHALAASPAAVSATAEAVFGHIGLIIVGIGALISIYGTINSDFMSMPRVVFSMSRDGMFPNFFSVLHPKWGTPYISISIYFLLAIVLLWSGSFNMLLLMSVFVARVMEILIITSCYVLRRKAPDMVRPLKMPGYPVTLIVVFLLTIFLALQVDLHDIIIGIIFGLTTIPAYIIFRFIKNKGHWNPLEDNLSIKED